MTVRVLFILPPVRMGFIHHNISIFISDKLPILDLARRQQRIPVALLAERAGLSMPTVTKMLRTGNGSFENFLRIARLLGLLDGVQQATDPLNTDIGKLRADEDTPKRIR